MKRILMYVVMPLPYATGILKMLIDTLIANFLLFIDSFESKDERLYKAKFGDVEDFLSPYNDGYCLTGTGNITRKIAAEGVLVTGAIGSGKGAVIAVNSVIQCVGSRVIIVNDPSGETKRRTIGYAATKCKTVVYNWTDVKNSDSFNPLQWAQSKSALYKVASILAYATQGTETKEPFWVLQCINVLYAFSAITRALDPVYRNFSNVRHLISQFMSHPEKVDPLFLKHADDELLEMYYAINAMSENTRQSVLATTLSALSLWNDENVTRLTAASSFDFKSIRKQPVIIYVQNSTINSKLYAPLIEIFYEELLSDLFSHLPAKDDLDCMFIFDEASTMPLKNSMNSYLNNARKYKLNFLLMFQSQQIESIYGSEASSIKAALRTKVWLAGSGLDVSAELEKLIGRTETKGKDGKVAVHPLMPAEDIRQMKDECIIISPDGQIYKTTTTPYFKLPFINMKTKIPPVEVTNNLVPDVVPLIKLHAPEKKK